MNIVSLTALPALLADIVVGPPPPPPDLVAGPLSGNTLASLGFWAFATVAAAGLWWLRRQRIRSIESAVPHPK